MEKKKITILFLLTALTLSPSLADAADGYFSAGAGFGGMAKAYNLTIEGGAKEIKMGHRTLLIGAGIPLIPHGYDNVPSDTYDYPCPHPDYVTLDKEYDGTELGFYAKVGMETVRPGIYLSTLLGFTRVTRIQVSESVSTGRHYEQSSDKEVYWMLGVGVTYFKELFDDDWRFCFQLDLDNRRGATGSVGFYW